MSVLSSSSESEVSGIRTTPFASGKTVAPFLNVIVKDLMTVSPSTVSVSFTVYVNQFGRLIGLSSSPETICEV